MKSGAIISRGESLQILMNDLRKAALEKRSAQLNEVSPEEREAYWPKSIARFGSKYAGAAGGLPCGGRFPEDE